MPSSPVNLEALGRTKPAAAGGAIPPPARRWRTAVLIPLLVVGGMLGLLGYTARKALWPAVQVRVVPVVLTGTGAQPSADEHAAHTGHSGQSGGAPAPGEVVAQAAGWIEADPFSISVPALTDGVVAEVLVLEGQKVEAGQVVARLIDEDADLAVQRADAEYNEKLADRAHAQAQLNAAQKAWSNPFARQRDVDEAEAMSAEADQMLGAAKAELAAEKTRLDEVRDEAKRKTALVESGTVSAGEIARLSLRVQAQQSMVAAAESKVGAAEAKVRQTRAGLTGMTEALRLRLDEARDLATAQAVIRQAETAIAKSQIMVAEAALRKKRTQVTTPVAGVVMSRMVEPGSRVMPGGLEANAATVLRLFDPARLQVRVDVPLGEASKVGVGQAAELTTEALPGRTFRGEVTRVVGEANIQRNTVQVKIAIKDPDASLRPDMLTKVRFLAGRPATLPDGQSAADASTESRLLAPKAALSNQSADTADVWVIDRVAGTASKKQVKFSPGPGDGWVTIHQGVNPGDRLVISDRSPLRDGSPVRVVSEESIEEPAAKPNGGTP